MFSDWRKNLKRPSSGWFEPFVRLLWPRMVLAEIDATAALGPEAVIENFLGRKDRIKIGAHSFVRGRLLTYAHGGKIEIGEWCYVGVRSEIWSMESVTIGNRVLIAHDVNIHDGSAHSMDALERHRHFRHIIQKGHPRDSKDLPGISSGPVIIEDDAWISFGAIILKGVRIGAGSIIAAGSIVIEDVPPNAFYRCEVTPIIKSLQSVREG